MPARPGRLPALAMADSGRPNQPGQTVATRRPPGEALGRSGATVRPARSGKLPRIEQRASATVPITALIQMRCAPGKCLLKTSAAADFPEIVEVLKVSGSHCTVLKVNVASVPHFEALTERLGVHGELQTSMVWSSALPRRVIDWEATRTPEARFAKAMDRLQVLAQNAFTRGRMWRERGVTEAMSRTKNREAMAFDPWLAQAFEALYRRAH
ncbi:MAG: Lrp/AsnC ligand binding domain-containing protein [Chloroflexota bacterium]|nr:Lrp/AsnC ligand binding domain-containing protein [Chloroflexota bacterium]